MIKLGLSIDDDDEGLGDDDDLPALSKLRAGRRGLQDGGGRLGLGCLSHSVVGSYRSRRCALVHDPPNTVSRFGRLCSRQSLARNLIQRIDCEEKVQ